MKEEFNKQYKQYIEDTLDIVFNEKTGKKTNNEWYKEKTDESIDIIDLGYVNVSYDSNLEITIIYKEPRYYNALDKNGNLLFDTWYEVKNWDSLSFNDGYALIRDPNNITKYNYVDINGNLISDDGFDDAYSFHDGFAPVKNGNKYNFIDTNGHFISKEGFDNARNFCEGYANVVIDGKHYFIDTNGNRTFDESFYDDNVSYINLSESFIRTDLSEGYALILLDHKYNYIDVNGKILSEEWFLDANPFSEELAKVTLLNGRTVFIDKSGTIVSDKWKLPDNAKIIGSFHNGLARISIGDVKNYIDKSGKVLVEKVKGYFESDTKKGFSSADDFIGGYALVGKRDDYGQDGKYDVGFLDTKGNYTYFTSRDSKTKYPTNVVGLANNCVYISYEDNGEYVRYIVDSKGYRLNNISFDAMHNDKDGNFTVKKNKIIYRMDSNGNLKCLTPVMKGVIKKYPSFIKIEPESFFEKKQYYCFVDSNGYSANRVFDDIKEISPGVYIVIKDKRYNIFYAKDNSLLHENLWYNSLEVSGNIAVSSNTTHDFRQLNRKTTKYIIQLDTRKVINLDTKDYYSERIKISPFQDGHAVVMGTSGYIENKYNIIDAEGKMLLKDWTHYSLELLGNGYVKYTDRDNGKTGIKSLDGNEIVPLKKHKELGISLNFNNIDGNLFPVKTEMKGLTVKNSPFGYQVSDGETPFKMRYKPVMNYDNRYFICTDKTQVKLFDKISNSYETLGSYDKVEYDDNFININDGEIIYLMYNGHKIDATDYYKKHLIHQDKICVSKDVNVLEPSDLYSEKEDEIREKFREALKENERIKNELKVKEQNDQVAELQRNTEREERQDEIRKLEAIRHLTEGVRVLEELTHKKAFSNKDRIVPYGLMVNVSDHVEINPYYLETKVLKFFDLSNVSFKNAKLTGIDFRGCNISFNPQVVYNKDLSNCNFEGIYFPVSTNFTDVNICGAKFTNDGRATTFDISSHNFIDAIYDETTTLNGIPLTELIKKDSAKK